MADLSNKYLFSWKIENFSLCALKNEEFLLSPTFKAESLGGSEWWLRLYPRRRISGKEDFVSLYLCRAQNKEKEITDFEIEMISFEGEIIRKLNEKHSLNTTNGFGWEDFMARDLFDKTMNNMKKDILTIRCHLKNNSKSSYNPACGSESFTKFGVDRCCFQWNVKFLDYSSLKSSKDVLIGEKTQFEFILTALNDEIVINIRRIDKEISATKVVACKISLIDLKGEEIESKKEIHIFEGDAVKDTWKFPTFLSKNLLSEKTVDLIKNNIFILKCEVSTSNGEKLSEFMNVKYEVPASPCLDDSFSALQDDLRNTFKTKNNSDVTLRVGSSIFPVHKYILCARSPVFRAMFDQNMRESQTGIVDIEDIDSEILVLFLEFLYTGCMAELTFENAMKLLIVANKYQVLSLTEKCSKFLITELSVKNVCDVYGVGDLINNVFLKSAAHEFIAENSAIVLSSDAWSDWMKENVGLANEILFKFALHLSK